MEQRYESQWRRTRAHAEGYLRRHVDPWTRFHREDLVQEAAVAAWQWSRRLQNPGALPAAVRTITRRIRSRALFVRRRERRTVQALPPRDVGGRERTETMLVVAGRRLPEHVVRPWLDQALTQLTDLDRCLLLSFHEGFCCAELASRFHRSVPCVKTRIHRARRRVQRLVETFARVASSPGK